MSRPTPAPGPGGAGSGHAGPAAPDPAGAPAASTGPGGGGGGATTGAGPHGDGSPGGAPGAGSGRTPSGGGSSPGGAGGGTGAAPPAGAPSPWEDLLELCRFPHRGSGTPQEARAARWLASRLRELGWEVEIQEFPTPRHTLYLGPAWTGIALALLALAGAGRQGAAAAFLSLLAAAVLVPLLGEVALWPAGWRVNLSPLLPRARSQNVIAWLPGARDAGDAGGAGASGEAGPRAPGPLHVIVTAHYDTQWGSWLFAPGFLPWLRAFFTAGYAAFLAVPLLLAARAAGLATALPLQVAAAASLAVAGFLLVSWRFGRPVNGANDNGSGVAVALALARRWREEPLPGVTLTIALTGAEEVGMRGMAALLAHPRMPWHRPGTPAAVINIDNVGAGRLHFLTAEGMLFPVRYDRRLVDHARALAAALPPGRLTPGPRPLLPTDALLPAARGIPAITFLATGPGGRIPHYHWHTDRPEHVDPAHLAATAGILWAYLDRLARSR